MATTDSEHYFWAPLRTAGWRVLELKTRRVIPPPILQRYPWLPLDLIDFLETTAFANNAHKTAWFVTSPEIHGVSGAPRVWNECELESLASAAAEPPRQVQIREFWDTHFPLLHLVGLGHAYLAVERETQALVYGEDPFYESFDVMAPSWRALAELIASRNSRFESWL